MADKPAAKPARKPVKRGPTKAQALKALGLTQEDLDALKGLKQEIEQDEQKQKELLNKIEAQQQAKRETYKALVEQEEPVPSGLKAEVEQPRVWYVRNLRNVEFSFRLQRQEAQGQKRTNLKPRGQRGDMVKLDAGDLNDSNLQTQVAYQIVEVIPEGEALAVVGKQSYNSQQTPHAALSVLRGPLGQPYAEGAVTVASNEEANGIKVADLRPNPGGGEYGEVVVDRGGIQRDLSHERVNVETGGNPAIISDGFAAQNTGQNLGGASQADIAKDALARSKDFEGPGAGLGQVAVVIEPTRRT